MIVINRSRSAVIPEKDRRIGFVNDNLVETRLFEIKDANLFGFSFKLDIENTSDVVDLTAYSQSETSLVLEWNITSEMIGEGGILRTQLRAFDNGERVWHSDIMEFVAEKSVDAVNVLSNEHTVSEFEQVEARVQTALLSAEASAADALSSKNTAAAKALEAASSASSASQSASSASASAASASGYAETALGGASSALASETNARAYSQSSARYADSAYASSVEAESSAADAAMSRANAVIYAGQASESAQSAAQSAAGAREIYENLQIKQTTGSSTSALMSQKAVTDALSEKVDIIQGKGLSENDYTTAEKTKLAGIEAQANKTVVDASITENSENPVKSSAIYGALAGKVDIIQGKGLSENDYTTAEKTKLAGIEAQANKTVVDSSVTENSENPVKSSALYNQLYKKVVRFDVAGTNTTPQERMNARNNIGAEVYLQTGATTKEKVQEDGRMLIIPLATHEKCGLIGCTDKEKLDELKVRPDVETQVGTGGLLEVNKIYNLGLQTSLTLKMPTGIFGDFIRVDFISGDSAATLAIDASDAEISDYDLEITANSVISMRFDWARLYGNTCGWLISCRKSGIVRFNQILENGNFESTAGWAPMRGSISAEDGVLTYTITEAGTGNNNRFLHPCSVISGHIYAACALVKTSVSKKVRFLCGTPTSEVFSFDSTVPASVWTQIVGTRTMVDNDTMAGIMLPDNNSVSDTLEVKNFMLVDLTYMFGAGNEPSSTEDILAACAKAGHPLSVYQPYSPLEN
ncbi:MAG: hypothetical protein J5844_03840 [Clostridia bacterium]|nr:hypothetical protein [Clostridia bacterium]